MIIQFGLAEEHDVQKFVPVGLKVGQQADFFQCLGRHGVRLVYHDNDLTAGRVDVNQPILQSAQQLVRVTFQQRCTQFLRNGVKNFITRQRGVGQVDRLDVLRQLLQQHPAEHGFSTAHFTADLDDAFVVRDGVNQCFERGSAIGARKKELGMRCDAKRGFAESEMVKIHSVPWQRTPYGCRA